MAGVITDLGTFELGEHVACEVTLDGAPIDLRGTVTEGNTTTTYVEGTNDQSGTGDGWVDLTGNVYELRVKSTKRGIMSISVQLTTAAFIVIARARATIVALI